jgi:hypothetical protein
MLTRSPLLLAAVLAGCAHTDVSLNAGAASRTGSGTRIVSSGAGLQVNATGGTAVALAAGVVIAGAMHDLHNPPPAPRYESFSDWFWGRPAPTMDPDRTVSEQDCTKPITGSGNLQCR